MRMLAAQESWPFRSYFIFLILTSFLGIIALGLAIFLLEKSAATPAILAIYFAFFVMVGTFFTVLFTFRKKISEVAKKELLLSQFLQRSNLSKTTFIKSASHDIKNYVFGISGLLKLILHNKTEAEIKANDDLKMIEALQLKSEELMRFVEDLFDTNQDECDDLDPSYRRLCNVIDLAQRMVILNKNFAMKNRVNLEFDNKTNNQIVKVECNTKRLKQILQNLIRNAIKSSAINDLVIVQISAINNHVQISVIDQGNGNSTDSIKDANLDQLDPHNLSFNNMRNLIESYHGKFEINAVKGYGTEVKINIIAAQDHNSSEQKLYSENSIDNSFENKAVLVAEDNLITSKVITFLLRKMGFKVKHVDNGAEILEQLDNQHFDLIFLDINMPKLGGFETAKTIREGKVFKRFKNYNIPIIAISTEKQQLSDLKNHGINMMLGKPFSEKELIDFVMEYVK